MLFNFYILSIHPRFSCVLYLNLYHHQLYINQFIFLSLSSILLAKITHLSRRGPLQLHDRRFLFYFSPLVKRKRERSGKSAFPWKEKTLILEKQQYAHKARWQQCRPKLAADWHSYILSIERETPPTDRLSLAPIPKDATQFTGLQVVCLSHPRW